MFDYFIGELHCPHCATDNGISAYTNMQTHIRGVRADGSQLAVGFSFDPRTLAPAHIVDAGYALISAPEEPMSPRLLEVWSCPACETEQWAEIEIVQLRIERISAVVLNRASFEASNYIEEMHGEWRAAALMGITWAEFSQRKLNCVDVLRERLE